MQFSILPGGHWATEDSSSPPCPVSSAGFCAAFSISPPKGKCCAIFHFSSFHSGPGSYRSVIPVQHKFRAFFLPWPRLGHGGNARQFSNFPFCGFRTACEISIKISHTSDFRSWGRAKNPRSCTCFAGSAKCTCFCTLTSTPIPGND